MAVRDLIEKIQYRKTNYVVEADIRGFFDAVDHGWLIKMLEHDIADRKFIETSSACPRQKQCHLARCSRKCSICN